MTLIDCSFQVKTTGFSKSLQNVFAGGHNAKMENRQKTRSLAYGERGK